MTADAVGGVWIYALELAAHLARRDVHTTLVVMGPSLNDAQREQARRIPSLTLIELDCKLEWMHDPWREVDAAGEDLLCIAQREAVDLVHLNGYVHANLAWQTPVLVAAHSCVCTWWEAVHGCAPPHEWDEYRTRVAAGLAAADHIVAPSAAFGAQLQRCYGVEAPLTVIHNARSRWRLARREPKHTIFACGRLWDEAKNMRALDRAVRELPQSVRVGGAIEGPDGGRFAAENLELLGPLSGEELAQELARASIYVHPARYEPFGLSVLEAAIAGCALVLNDLPTSRELWDGAACFVPMDDAPRLHAALQGLIAEPERRRELARAAALRARRYTVRRMARAYRALYSDLTARGRARERAVA